MRALHVLSAGHPMLFIRARGQRNIVRQVRAESLNQADVQEQVKRLASDFPADRYEVDASQVEYARLCLLA